MIYELIVREKLKVRKVIVASSQATFGEGLYLDADGKRVLPGMRSDDSSRAVWEIQPPPGPARPAQYQHTDETVANPQNPYGMSKIAEESIALNLGRRYGVPIVAMRYSIVQGPRQSFYNAYSGACRVFCLSFHQGRSRPSSRTASRCATSSTSPTSSTPTCSCSRTRVPTTRCSTSAATAR